MIADIGHQPAGPHAESGTPDSACGLVDVPLQAGVSIAGAHLCAPIDANGNLTSDGARTFEWDARNQLVAVTVGTHRSEFSYDGLRRRVSMVEKENGVVQSHLRAVWCEMTICEERAADGVTVTRRVFALGEQVNGQARYFTTDHLGSVREVTDAAGTLLRGTPSTRGDGVRSRRAPTSRRSASPGIGRTRARGSPWRCIGATTRGWPGG